MVQPFACCRPIRLPRGAAEERCGAVFRLLSTPPTSLAYAHLRHLHAEWMIAIRRWWPFPLLAKANKLVRAIDADFGSND